ncbi:MAG: HAD-IA family hydrolase [Chloroflexi bacterium]|nr:HAD-IA family hydrolase [Chloroflexota bacterium]
MPTASRTTGQDPPTRNVVTLDLWLTLITEQAFTSRGGVGRSRERLSRVMDALASAGHPVDEDELEASFKRVQEDIDHAHANGVDRTFPLWVRQIIDYTLPGVFDTLSDEAAGEIISAVDEPFLAAPPVAHPKAGEVLSALTEAGLRLALISNTGFTSGDIYRRWFDDIGWRDRFEVTTFSNEAAVAKPTASIFTSTLAEMNALPEQALHVGDNLLSDIAGAHRVGMCTAWISGYDSREPEVEPDYVLEDLADLPAVVERWRTP